MIENIETICEFIYMDYESAKTKGKYEWLEEIKLIDLHCKHIMKISLYTKHVFDSAERAFRAQNVPNRVIWGVHRNGTEESERNIIKKMISDNFSRPVRIVIDQFGRVWADNTHTVISWVIRKGVECRLKDIPFYAVDLRETTKIISINGTVHDSVKEIKTAIACADRIKRLIQFGYRDVGTDWKIRCLMIDIGILPCCDLESLISELMNVPIGTEFHTILCSKSVDEQMAERIISRLSMILLENSTI